MKDYDKFIKALLVELNRNGIEVNYEVRSIYSQNFNAMITKCYLKFWHSRIVIDKKTGKEVAKNWCEEKEFKGATKYANVIKYLQACMKGEKENDS